LPWDRWFAYDLSIGMAKTAPMRLGLKAALFEPGERLGWIFRDRFLSWQPFQEPSPAEKDRAPWQSDRIAELRKKRTGALLIGAAVTVVCFLAYVVALLVYRFVVNWGQTHPQSMGTGFAVNAWLIAGVPPLITLVGVPLFFTLLIHRAFQARDQAVQTWHARRTEHDARERDRVEQLLEWGAARVGPGTRRVDVFGGNLWSWEAFLTVYGTSMLRESPPITVVDLSEELVSDELFQLARGARCPVDRQVLPAELAHSDLLVGLDRQRLVDVLVESFHGDSQEPDRAERTMDARILTEVCGALGEDVSVGRVAEALRALMGEPGRPVLLSPEEWDRVTTELFSGAYVEQAHERLRRLEAYLHPLTALGIDPVARDPEARLRCLAVTNDGPNPFSDLLVDLIVQWTMRQVAHDAEHAPSRLLVIAGADHLRRRHLERLSDICERRHVRLVYLFRHLREQSLQMVGGGAVGFMRLGNHEEAERAASFIGREHKFVVSSISRGLSGGATHSVGSSEGGGDGGGSNQVRRGVVFRETVGYTRSESRNWGTSRQYSEQTGWSYQSSEQRVYEYRVEPRTLQELPDHALLLVEHSSAAGQSLQVVECNPDILSLPRASTDVLPEPASAPAIEAPTARDGQVTGERDPVRAAR
jgi:hypothetical protein